MSETRQRQHQVGVRLTDEEHAALLQQAATEGATLPNLLRARALLVTVAETPSASDRDAIAEWLRRQVMGVEFCEHNPWEKAGKDYWRRRAATLPTAARDEEADE